MISRLCVQVAFYNQNNVFLVFQMFCIVITFLFLLSMLGRHEPDTLPWSTYVAETPFFIEVWTQYKSLVFQCPPPYSAHFWLTRGPHNLWLTGYLLIQRPDSFYIFPLMRYWWSIYTRIQLNENSEGLYQTIWSAEWQLSRYLEIWMEIRIYMISFPIMSKYWSEKNPKIPRHEMIFQL